jgi:hypothetical protein
MDNGVDSAQRRRPVGVRPDLSDDAGFHSGMRFPRGCRSGVGTTLRQHQRVVRRQDGEEGATDKATCAGDEDSAHRAIIGKQSDLAKGVGGSDFDASSGGLAERRGRRTKQDFTKQGGRSLEGDS